MLEAARQGDWDRLIALEHDRASLNAVLQEQEKLCTWLAADRFKKGELIRAILANDAETILLVEPRREELHDIFSSLYSEKKLQKAYAIV